MPLTNTQPYTVSDFPYNDGSKICHVIMANVSGYTTLKGTSTANRYWRAAAVKPDGSLEKPSEISAAGYYYGTTITIACSDYEYVFLIDETSAAATTSYTLT